MGDRQHMSPSGSKSPNVVIPVTPKYLQWSEAPITFDRADHPDHIPHPGRYPLLLDPIVRMTKLNKVLIDGGSELNILFAKTLDDMKISRSELKWSNSPCHRVIPGTSAIPPRADQLARHTRHTGEFPDRENFFRGR